MLAGKLGRLALRARYKVFPPPIWSPYLYNPKFLKEYTRILTLHAIKADLIVEFGPRDGYSTAIMADACYGQVYAFDTFEKVPFETVARNLKRFHNVCLCNASIHDWPVIAKAADLIYIDVGNDARLIDNIYYGRKYAPKCTILFEGAARFKPLAPYEVLTPVWPGIGRLMT